MRNQLTLASRGRRRSRGQSLTEFALLIPVMLAFTGVIIDFARAYQTWENLESASRAAAESLATSDKLDPTTSANANTKAKVIVDAETGQSFATGSSLGACGNPILHATYSEGSDAGGSTSVVGTAFVEACTPFRSLFPYPFLTSNGVWRIQSSKTFSVIQGR
jgi:Flp pilus assembly protein TadG